MDKIKVVDFYQSLYPVLVELSRKILEKIGEKYWPNLWQMVPEDIKMEINKKAMEESEAMFAPILEDLKANIDKIFCVKEMCIYRLTTNRQLLVDMFLKIGSRELKFVEHVGAVMG